MPRLFALTLIGVGVVLMIIASVWAPAQPELWQDGASCEIAQCGMLEDPARWRAAWWVWAAGFAMLVIAVPATARPQRINAWWLLAFVVSSPVWLLGYGFLAYLVSLFTSVQGAATLVGCGFVAPVLAIIAGALKRVTTIGPTTSMVE